MIKRTVEISSGNMHVRLRQGQLVMEQEKKFVGSIPAEDVGLLIFDSHMASCTQSALTAAMENDAAVIVCGNDHQPVGLMLPYEGNQLHAERLRLQLDLKKPLLKRLWQQIVQAKIKRQADLLEQGSAERTRLRRLAKDVRSGDPDNHEAQAARFYWPALFGSGFRRSREGDAPNNLLNYGYMAVRASTARAICGAGLHPAIGIHHSHRNNTFCLADDLMEPYRPFVDKRVKELWEAGEDAISKKTKAYLLKVLTDEVIVAGQSGPLMVALGKSAASLVHCFSGERSELDLPQP